MGVFLTSPATGEKDLKKNDGFCVLFFFWGTKMNLKQQILLYIHAVDDNFPASTWKTLSKN